LSKETINGQHSGLMIDCDSGQIQIIGPFTPFSSKAIMCGKEICGYTQKGRIKTDNNEPKKVNFRFNVTSYSPLTVDEYNLYIATPEPHKWIETNLYNSKIVRFGIHFQEPPTETVLTFSLNGFTEALNSCPQNLPSGPYP